MLSEGAVPLYLTSHTWEWENMDTSTYKQNIFIHFSNFLNPYFLSRHVLKQYLREIFVGISKRYKCHSFIGVSQWKPAKNLWTVDTSVKHKSYTSIEVYA